MNNKLKKEKYRDLMFKLKKAINNEFYYEAIFIEYAILEDRTESLLRHADLSAADSNGKPLKLNAKLKKLENSTTFNKDKYILKHLNIEILSETHNWKNKRNILIHDLIKSTYTYEDVKKIALEGYELVKMFNNKSILINRYIDNLNKCN